MLVPLVPGAFMLLGLIMLGGDMGTSIILAAILFGLLWTAGAPTRLFVGVLTVAGAIGFLLIKTSANRMKRFDCIGATDPGGEGAPASRRRTESMLWPRADGSVPDSVRASRNGANSPKRTPTSSSRSPVRNWVSRGRCRYSPCSRL